jgi:hypothetical protein
VALAAAGAVVVAVVPWCWQEAINAMPMMALIKHNRYFFIGLVSVRVVHDVWLPKKLTARH